MNVSNDSVFDRLASAYDTSFSERLPARWLRQRVRDRISQCLPSKARVLDVGCGTGDDAIWFASHGHGVVATDLSAGMLEVTRRKFEAAPQEIRSRLTVATYDAAGVSDDFPGGDFDLVFSNFGALNCVEDLGPFFEDIHRHISSSGTVALTLMGRFCLWETIGFGLRGDLRRACRRWSGRSTHAVDAAVQPVWYHAISAVKAMAGQRFEVLDVTGVGVFIPSSEFFPVCERRPGLFRWLARIESKIGALWPFNRMGDHFLIMLQKSDGGGKS